MHLCIFVFSDKIGADFLEQLDWSKLLTLVTIIIFIYSIKFFLKDQIKFFTKKINKKFFHFIFDS